MRHLPRWIRAQNKRDKEVARKYAMGVNDALAVLEYADDRKWLAGHYLDMPGMLTIETDDWWLMGFVGILVEESKRDVQPVYLSEKECRAASVNMGIDEIQKMLEEVSKNGQVCVQSA